MDIDKMSKDEIEDLQISTEKEYQLAMQNLYLVELKDIEISKRIAELQLERKNLSTALIQGKYNLRRTASELRNIKTMLFKRIGGM